MRAKSTGEKMVAAAGKLLDREGSDAVTMRSVAKAVGITPMALYRHVADRDGLLNLLADAGFERLAGRVAEMEVPKDPEQQLWVILERFVDFALEKPRLFELMFLKPRPGARRFPEDFREGRSPTAKFAAAALEKGMREGVFRKDDVWEITFEMGALLQGMVMLYVGGRVEETENEFRDHCRRAFGRYLHGIRR